MKKLSFLLVVVALSVGFSGGGVNSAIVLNHNQHSTLVHPESNNYRLVDKVKGSAERTLTVSAHVIAFTE